MPTVLDSIFNIFRPASYPKDNTTEPAQITRSKVLVIVYDPIMDKTTGVKLSKYLKWYDPSDLLVNFISDITEVSKGLVRYEIVQRIDVNEFPAKTDGFRYTPQTFLDVWNRTAAPHTPQEVNYAAILTQFNVLNRIARSEIDEVWIFGFPYAGFYESTMGGPGAFWCNAPPLANTANSKRRFVVMGFSYERGVGEMHESYGHRAESILEKTFSKLTGDANLWQRFIRYEKSAPGKAACGNIHFAPNSQVDYEWGNMTPVKSECYDWLLNFPNFKGDTRIVDASEWGGGEIRAHHKWWFRHFPRVMGRKNGIHNNWWQYVAAPQQVIL
ncbi:MAG: hypothetical protein IPG80_12360 [Anaerolineales bacterium]|uniref:hypothetical protein n=1 Tax=Candidatus Villigracilis vicinus TaxID=3140679 RepID=UPI0031351384|nr:hypothetical protein [Anaerolineales bacterium]MBK7450159.1 hypothetical protein [Anaerolineales bacterium]